MKVKVEIKEIENGQTEESMKPKRYWQKADQ